MIRLISNHRSSYKHKKKDSFLTLKKCIFCYIAEEANSDDTFLVLSRKKDHYIVVNRYPYNIGHILIIPNRHIIDLVDLKDDEAINIMLSIKNTSSIIHEVYKPHGMNVGVNIGLFAGASIPEHLHFHIVPRWSHDTSFITTISKSRVMSESPEDTFKRLNLKFIS